MSKKIFFGGIVLIALGVGGYLLYKKMKQPTRKMFDEMVANCTPPCDIFSGSTQNRLDKLFDEYKKLKMEDAQFMIDYLAKKDLTQNTPERQRFETLIKGMVNEVRTKYKIK